MFRWGTPMFRSVPFRSMGSFWRAYSDPMRINMIIISQHNWGIWVNRGELDVPTTWNGMDSKRSTPLEDDQQRSATHALRLCRIRAETVWWSTSKEGIAPEYRPYTNCHVILRERCELLNGLKVCAKFYEIINPLSIDLKSQNIHDSDSIQSK